MTITSADFSKDITEELCSANLSTQFLDELVKLYNDTLSAVLDDHAPLKRKKAPTHQKVPWLNEQISNEIRLRRKAEWAWLKVKSNLNKYLSFHQQRRYLSNMTDQTEKEYYLTKLSESTFKTKQVFTICNNLLGKDKDLPLPPGYTNHELADNFNEFITRIANIGKEIMDS